MIINQVCLVSSYHFPELSLVSLSHLSMGLHELSCLLCQSPETVNNTYDLISEEKEEMTKHFAFALGLLYLQTLNIIPNIFVERSLKHFTSIPPK